MADSATVGRMNACSRPALVANVREACTDLGAWMRDTQLPVVYREEYNIGFWGLERVHPFDSHKFRKVVAQLQKAGLLKADQLVTPVELTTEQLLDVHTEAYLRELHSSRRLVANVVDLPLLALVPHCLLQRKVLQPMRYMAGGTMLAAVLALERGWSINLGGGMHHACFEEGGGWCAYSDIYLAIRQLRRASGGRVQKFMIIDLDVHQGNGHARDKLHFNDNDTFILDMFGQALWPADGAAKAAIDYEVPLPLGIGDEVYLPRLQDALEASFDTFKPDFVIYNAGTDILKGDPLGRMNVSAQGIASRDAAVFEAARGAGVPLCMLLSGGYSRGNFAVIANSIENLMKKFQLLGLKLNNGEK